MKNAKFWLGLWAGKFATWVYKLQGNPENDRPGILARRFDIEFLKHASKPANTTIITGTNGKSGLLNMITDMYRRDEKRIVSNTRGNNSIAGETWIFLKANSIFNKTNCDVAVIESDELFAPLTFPQIDPDYILITNIARDSMFRNASPDFIQKKLDRGMNDCHKATLILNGDDPLSCFLAQDRPRVLFGISNCGIPETHFETSDFVICPKCGEHPVYNYRNYRDVGDFYCPKCGLKSPERDYQVIEYDEKNMKVREKDGSVYSYPLFSNELHNMYNAVSIVAYFRTLGWAKEKIADYMQYIALPSDRKMEETVNGITVSMRTAKSQNFTACSITYSHDSLETEEKDIILLADEEYKKGGDPIYEVATWIYDTQYDFLNRPNVRKIIVGGDRYLDHKLHLLMSGIPAEKIIAMRNIRDTAEYADITGIKKIAIYRGNYCIEDSDYVYKRLLERIREGK